MWETSHPPRPANRISAAAPAPQILRAGRGSRGRSRRALRGWCPSVHRAPRLAAAEPLAPPDENVFQTPASVFPWESAHLIVEKGERGILSGADLGEEEEIIYELGTRDRR